MQQYFVNEYIENKDYSLNANDSFHILKVMRKKVNDKIYIAFKGGERYVCNIKKIDNNTVIVFPELEVNISTELPLETTIAIPPLKGTKIEFLIQKSTELGVNNIILFNSERNVAKLKNEKIDNKISRWEKIAKEAAEQSKRGIIPKIIVLKDINELISYCDNYDYKVIAYENEAQNKGNDNLKNLFKKNLNNISLLAVFGSEGGLSENEVAKFTDAGYTKVGLGKRILRAETAPIFFLSCVIYFSEIL